MLFNAPIPETSKQSFLTYNIQITSRFNVQNHHRIGPSVTGKYKMNPTPSLEMQRCWVTAEEKELCSVAKRPDLADEAHARMLAG
jgi:hypothetical protein